MAQPLPVPKFITDGLPERLVIVTRHNTDHYQLPAGTGEILRITVSNGSPKPFLFFEAPAQTSYFHLLSNGIRPATPEQARAYLRQVHEKFRSNLFFRLGDAIYLYPAPVNEGDNLIVLYQP